MLVIIPGMVNAKRLPEGTTPPQSLLANCTPTIQCNSITYQLW